MTILGGTNYSKKQVVRMFKSKESCIWTVRNTTDDKSYFFAPLSRKANAQ